ncbi:hypothetical protein [Microvirga vignae]|uniref:hypothetical protein n=1 Tax=Microvirga vignae TaxID=1225564 RepID=UPI003CC79E16
MVDFAQAVGSADSRLAASAKFVDSPAALPAFENVYGFRFPRGRSAVQPRGDI